MENNYLWPERAFKQSGKSELLHDLRLEIEHVDLSFKSLAQNLVFGDGDINASVMFIGEAPGHEEDAAGLPFVGRSGQLLRGFLKEAKIENFYITNIIPWRPPKNRTPTQEEIEIMRPYVYKHVEIIDPTIIVLVGTTALKAFEIDDTITNVQNLVMDHNVGKVFSIYHPAYALRVNSKKKDLWQSLLLLRGLF